MNMLRRFAYPLILVVIVSALVLSFFSLSTLYTTVGSNAAFYKQLGIVVVSILAGTGVSLVQIRFLRQGNIAFYAYLAVLVLLVGILILGATVNNAQSWLRIGGVSLQPSEIAKLAVIFVLAKYLYRRHIDIANIRHVIMSFTYAAFAGLLVLRQPDLGSALVIFGIWGGMLFVSGVSKKHLLLIVAATGLLFGLGWQFLFQAYQKERILNFLDPLRDVRGSGYNVYQSIIAVGSGGVYGKGIAQGTQSSLKYLPESDTDFIFASFAEEWGFIGSALCIFLFFILVAALITISLGVETNFETLVIIGYVSYFLIHFVVNIGMNLGLLPVTGIPLPFMSAGGTHTLLEWIMLGTVISMYGQTFESKKNLANKELFTY